MRIVTLTVGYGFDKNNNPLPDASNLLQKVRQNLAQTFGGFTETEGVGGWINPDTGVEVMEACKVYSIATDKPSEIVETSAAVARDTLHQHSVFIVDNNTPKFV